MKVDYLIFHCSGTYQVLMQVWNARGGPCLYLLAVGPGNFRLRLDANRDRWMEALGSGSCECSLLTAVLRADLLDFRVGGWACFRGIRGNSGFY